MRITRSFSERFNPSPPDEQQNAAQALGDKIGVYHRPRKDLANLDYAAERGVTS